MPVKKSTTKKTVVSKVASKKVAIKAVTKLVHKSNRAVKANTKTDPKFDVYKKLLLKTKDQILGDIQNLSDDNSGSGNGRGGDVSGHALHMADVATDMYDREFTLSLASNDRELLHSIDEALGRIVDGTFGACVQCKKPIPSTRLKAIAHARTCMKCQEKLESKRPPAQK